MPKATKKEVKKTSKKTSENIFQFLARVQQELKVPKKHFNKFGDFHYRSCEDILEAIKPLLGEYAIVFQDDIEIIVERYYIKSTATLINGDQTVSTSAYAREPLNKTKMDEAQVTGASSSYARKYTLNALFAIDDAQDADTQKPEVKKAKKVISDQDMKAIADLLGDITNAKNQEQLEEVGEQIKQQAEDKKVSANQLTILRKTYDSKMKKLDLGKK